MIVQPMDTQERRIREELRALAHQDRSLGASVATEQAVMARWDAEHVAGAQRSGRSGRSQIESRHGYQRPPPRHCSPALPRR
jgi:hypothetical protein